MTVTSHDIANAIAEYRTLPGENWSRLASDIQRAIDAKGRADEEAQWERMIAHFDCAGPSVVDGTGWAEAAFVDDVDPAQRVDDAPKYPFIAWGWNGLMSQAEYERVCRGQG